MKLDLVRLRILTMRLRNPFTTSFGTQTERTFVLVEAASGGVFGLGEVTAFSAPLYNEEFTAGAFHVLRHFLVPAVLARPFSHPSEIAERLAFVRRHQMAKAGLEGALWDLWAKSQGIPLFEALGGERRPVPVGVSIGIQDSPERLVDTVSAFVREGYRRVKVKIEPGRDLAYVEAVRRRFPDLPLMADANSAYTLADTDRLRRLDAWNLMMIEQPLAHDDILEHAVLQRELRTPICLDESIHTPKDALHAIDQGALRILNIKVGRVGGITRARECHDVCRSRGIPVWCGGMLESGIGRAHNIALATLPGFTLPGDTSASARYWDRDIIEPAVTVSPDGTITPPDGPGIGFDPLWGEIDRLTETVEEIRP